MYQLDPQFFTCDVPFNHPLKYFLSSKFSCVDEIAGAMRKILIDIESLISFLSNSFKEFQGFTLFNISQMSNMSDSTFRDGEKRDLYSLWKFETKKSNLKRLTIAPHSHFLRTKSWTQIVFNFNPAQKKRGGDYFCLFKSW